MITRINYESKELAKQLLSQGLARVKYISPIPKNFFYYPDIDYYYQLLEIEKYAKVNKVGI
jgi:endonuclease YncB( thermonuclease family)